jgi:hypothetical protein
MTPEEIEAWKKKNKALLDHVNCPQPAVKRELPKSKGDFEVAAEHNFRRNIQLRRRQTTIPDIHGRQKVYVTNDTCRECGAKGYVMMDTWLCGPCDRKQYGTDGLKGTKYDSGVN